MRPHLVFLTTCLVACASTQPLPVLSLQAGGALVSAPGGSIAPNALMLRTPDVSADSIVFGYSSDLWIVPKTGGLAQRITSSEGVETMPRFSPNGQRLAFMATYDGQSDLYVLDLPAGVPQRVTFHPDTERLWDWTPDGNSLLYSTNAMSGHPDPDRIVTIPASGGAPTPLPVPYGEQAALDAEGRWLAYVPTAWENANWKRYQGGLAAEIWLYDTRENRSRRATEHLGNDFWPMWHGQELLFLSDRGENHISNLWAFDTQSGQSRALTNFAEFDCKRAAIGPQDVVFQNGSKLVRYELATGRSAPVDILIAGDRPRLRDQVVNAAELANAVTLGPSGKRVLVEARGEIFSAAVEDGVRLDLTNSPGSAERSPAWSPDGQWMAFFSDVSGEYQLCLRRVDAASSAERKAERVLTALGPGFREQPVWSPDGKRIAFSANDGSLSVVDVESGALFEAYRNPAGQPLGFEWSPDSRWIGFCASSDYRRLPQAYLYELGTRTLTAVTSGMFAVSGLSFDRDGDWAYLSSQRNFEPTYSDFDNSWIYQESTVLLAVPLRAEVKNPFFPEDQAEESALSKPEDEAAKKTGEPKTELVSADQAATDAKAAEQGAEPGGKTEQDQPKVLELAGFESRAQRLEIGGKSVVAMAGGKAGLFYLVPGSLDPEEGPGAGELRHFAIADKKDELVLAGVNSFELNAKGDKLLVQTEAGWAVIEAAPGQKVDKVIALDALEMSIDPRAEWRQVLVEAWRLVRDYFYDEKLHGLDWTLVRERMLAALPDCTTRADVHFLIGEMMAELNCGHAYSQPPPGMQSPLRGPATGLLGADFALDNGAWRITRILGPEPSEDDARSPLSQLAKPALVGEYLHEVNGRAVDVTQDLYASLVGTAGKPTWLRLGQEPKPAEGDRFVLVEALSSEADLRYRTWIADNRRLVMERSAGRVGYIHVPDTGINGQNELLRQLAGQLDKQALLLDDRWNHGGQIPDRFIELLKRPTRNFWAIRNGQDWVWPPASFDGPMAMLINGNAGSGGDCLPYYFRQSGLGKLIGMRTWGGLVGISGNPGLIDGASISVPRFAFYELDGSWGVEGYGVAPDIEVVDDPAKMFGGRDVQLEAGADQLVSELSSWKFPLQARPPPANRSGAGVRPEDH